MIVSAVPHGGLQLDADNLMLEAMYIHVGLVNVGIRCEQLVDEPKHKAEGWWLCRRRQPLPSFFALDASAVIGIVERAIRMKGGDAPTAERLAFAARRRQTLESAELALTTGGYDGIETRSVDKLLSGRVAYNGGNDAGTSEAAAKSVRHRVALSRMASTIAMSAERSLTEEDFATAESALAFWSESNKGNIRAKDLPKVLEGLKMRQAASRIKRQTSEKEDEAMDEHEKKRTAEELLYEQWEAKRRKTLARAYRIRLALIPVVVPIVALLEFARLILSVLTLLRSLQKAGLDIAPFLKRSLQRVEQFAEMAACVGAKTELGRCSRTAQAEMVSKRIAWLFEAATNIGEPRRFYGKIDARCPAVQSVALLGGNLLAVLLVVIIVGGQASHYLRFSKSKAFSKTNTRPFIVSDFINEWLETTLLYVAQIAALSTTYAVFSSPQKDFGSEAWDEYCGEVTIMASEDPAWHLRSLSWAATIMTWLSAPYLAHMLLHTFVPSGLLVPSHSAFSLFEIQKRFSPKPKATTKWGVAVNSTIGILNFRRDSGTARFGWEMHFLHKLVGPYSCSRTLKQWGGRFYMWRYNYWKFWQAVSISFGVWTEESILAAHIIPHAYHIEKRSRALQAGKHIPGRPDEDAADGSNSSSLLHQELIASAGRLTSVAWMFVPAGAVIGKFTEAANSSPVFVSKMPCYEAGYAFLKRSIPLVVVPAKSSNPIVIMSEGEWLRFLMFFVECLKFYFSIVVALTPNVVVLVFYFFIILCQTLKKIVFDHPGALQARADIESAKRRHDAAIGQSSSASKAKAKRQGGEAALQEILDAKEGSYEAAVKRNAKIVRVERSIDDNYETLGQMRTICEDATYRHDTAASAKKKEKEKKKSRQKADFKKGLVEEELAGWVSQIKEVQDVHE
jgi:hypothetical protein